MDFSLSESQQELAALTRTILTDRVTPERLRALEDAGPLFDRDLWRTLAEAGVVSAALPETVKSLAPAYADRLTLVHADALRVRQLPGREHYTLSHRSTSNPATSRARSHHTRGHV